MAVTVDTRNRATDSDAHVLIRVGRTTWEHLALLLLFDIGILLAAFPAVVLWLGGLPYLSLAMAVITCGPVLAGVVASVDRLNRDESVPVLASLGLGRRYAVRGIEALAVPASVAMALVALLDALSRFQDATWLVIPLLLTCSVAIIMAVASLAVFSLATTGGLRGWRLWRASLAVGVANPLASFGSLALLLVLVLVAGQVGFVLLAAIPAPFALLCSALCWAIVERYEGARPGVE